MDTQGYARSIKHALIAVVVAAVVGGLVVGIAIWIFS